MKSSRLTLMDMYHIQQDSDAGLSMEEIAELRGLHVNTVSKVLKREVGQNQRAIADRMEYFYNGLVTKDTGCYRACITNSDEEDGVEQSDRQVLIDPSTF